MVMQGLGMPVVFLLGLTVPVLFQLPLLLGWGGLLVLVVVAWNGVQRRVWPPSAAWLAPAILAVDAAAVWLVLVVVPGVLYCGGAERAVLAEFSQYQGVKAEAVGELETGACTLGFTTGDQAGAVVAYYRAQLASRGWTVRDGRSGRGVAEGRWSMGSWRAPAAPPSTRSCMRKPPGWRDEPPRSRSGCGPERRVAQAALRVSSQPRTSTE
jgi:hypothetical protein